MARIDRPSKPAAALLAAAALAAAAASPLPPRITFRGTIDLPATAADAAGVDVPLTGFSGVTWLDGDRYAAVMDNSDVVVRFRLALGAGGEPRAVNDVAVIRLGAVHDYEDIAIRPGAARQLLVCEEDTPAIHVAALDGTPLGAPLPLPEILCSRRPNRGLESLAIDPDGRHLWTATEEALPEDGPAATLDAGTVVRLVRMPLLRDDGQPAAQFAYAVDPPHRFAPLFGGVPVSGLVAIAPLGAGRLLVLERSGAPGVPPFAGRIHLVDTAGCPDVAGIDAGLAGRTDCHLQKLRLWEDALGINLEGMCLGPRLAAGGRGLVAVADNGGIGGPNRIACFAVTEPTAAGRSAPTTSPSPCSTRSPCGPDRGRPPSRACRDGWRAPCHRRPGPGIPAPCCRDRPASR